MMLEVSELSVLLKSTSEKLLDSISFSVDSGSSLMFIGLSGSGKTMICSALLRTFDRTVFDVTGSIMYCGSDLMRLRERELNRLYGTEIVYIPQNPMTAFDPSMRIGKQMTEVLRLHKKITAAEAKEKALSALEAAELHESGRVFSSYPFQLSGGMLQRVMFAMAIMTDAKLIVADEPTTALDAQLRISAVNTLAGLRERGAAVIMMTHDFRSAVRFGGNAAVIQNGRLIEQADISELLHTPAEQYTRELANASRMGGAI